MLSSSPTAPTLVRLGNRPSYYPVLMQALVFTSVLGLGVSSGIVYLFHIVLAIVALVNLTHNERGQLFDGLRLPGKYHGFFFFMFAWFAVGLAWSWDRSYTLQYLGYIACGGGLAVFITKYVGTSMHRFLQLFRAAQWAFAIDILAGLLEATTPFRLPISPFSSGAKEVGLDDFTSEAVSLIASMPTGFHWNPNNFAMVMCLLFPFFLNHRRIGVLLIGAASILFLTYFSDSRAALVALAFMVMLLPVFRGKSIWLFLGVGLILLSQFFFFSQTRVSQLIDTDFVHAIVRYSGMESSESTDSVGVRRHLIDNGFVALGETYGLGVGGGGDKAVQEEMYALPTREMIASMHHIWIELLVNGGVPFFACFVGWFAMLTWELFGYARKWPVQTLPGYFSRSLCLSLLGLIPAAVAASTAIYVLPMYMLFGFSMAMVNICRHQHRQQARVPAAKNHVRRVRAARRLAS